MCVCVLVICVFACTDYHTSELVFVFDNEFPPILHNFDANDRTISAAFQQYVRAPVCTVLTHAC